MSWWFGVARSACPSGPDADGDEVCDAVDDCPTVPDPGQREPLTPHEAVTAAHGGDLELGDFDGDGVMDLVAPDGDSVRLWLLGAGSSGARPVEAPTDVDAADLDGDGDLDVVAATRDLSLHWFENDGAGGFSTALPGPYGGSSVIATDLDGDGAAELFAGGWGGISVFENLGGTWGQPDVAVPFGSAATPVDAADLDGDGALDLLLWSAGSVAWSRNLGVAGWGPPTTIAVASFGVPEWVEAGDLDGDGTPDVAVGGTRYEWSGWWVRGLGGGAFGERAPLGPAQAGALTDLDGDGDLDVVTSHTELGPVGRQVWGLLVGQGGVFRPVPTEVTVPAYQSPYFYAPSATAFRAGDLDGDGDPDLAWTGLNAFEIPRVGWLELELPVPDLDADGRCDVDDVCGAEDDLRDLDGDGVPNACDACDAGVDSDADGVDDACDRCDGDDGPDQDGNGRPDDCDPCAADPADDADADGRCADQDTCVGASASDADGDAVCDDADPCSGLGADSDHDGVCDDRDACAGGSDGADLDRDGVADGCDPCPDSARRDADLDGVCDDEDACDGEDDGRDLDLDGVPDACDRCPEVPDAGQESILGRPTRWFDGIRFGLLGDLDTDGDLDLIGAPDDNVLLWSANRAGAFQPLRPLAAGLGGARAVAVADVDGDGANDLVLRGYGVTVSSGPAWQDRRPVGPEMYVNDLDVADLDGDGDPDFAVFGGRELGWIENRGERAVYTVVDRGRAHAGTAADLDGDGDLDLVTTDTHDLRWFEQTAPGTWRARDHLQDVAARTALYEITAADTDGDGDDELVIAADDLSVVDLSPSGFRVRPVADLGRLVRAAAGDADGDGDLDLLAVGDDRPDRVVVAENDRGSWGVTTLEVPGDVQEVSSAGFGDLDGDGLPDAVIFTQLDAGFSFVGRPWRLTASRRCAEGEPPPCDDSDADGLCDDVDDDDDDDGVADGSDPAPRDPAVCGDGDGDGCDDCDRACAAPSPPRPGSDGCGCAEAPDAPGGAVLALALAASAVRARVRRRPFGGPPTACPGEGGSPSRLGFGRAGGA